MSRKKQRCREPEDYFTTSDISKMGPKTFRKDLLGFHKPKQFGNRKDISYIFLKNGGDYLVDRDVRAYGPLARLPFDEKGEKKIAVSYLIEPEKNVAYRVLECRDKEIAKYVLSKYKEHSWNGYLNDSKTGLSKRSLCSAVPHTVGKETKKGELYKPQISKIKVDCYFDKKDSKGGPIAITTTDPFNKGVSLSKKGMKILNWDLYQEWKEVRDNPKHPDKESILSRCKEFAETEWSWEKFEKAIPSKTVLKAVGYVFRGYIFTPSYICPIIKLKHLYYSEEDDDMDLDPDDVKDDEESFNINVEKTLTNEDIKVSDEVF